MNPPPSRLARRRRTTSRGTAAPAPHLSGRAALRTPTRLSGRHRWWVRRAVGTLCLGVAAACGVQLLAPPPPPSTQVLLTTRDVGVGERLSASAVTSRAWPTALAPPGAVTEAELVEDVPAAVTLPAGTVVTEAMLVHAHLIDDAPPGTRVVSVTLRSAADARLARPGSRVSFVGNGEIPGHVTTVGSGLVLATVTPEGSGSPIVTHNVAHDPPVTYVAASPDVATMLAGAVATGPLSVVAGG